MTLLDGTIQVAPPGLMGFLNLKSGGQMPKHLDDAYVPILELTQWILMAQREDLPESLVNFAPAAATGAFTVFTTAPITVPNIEWWWVSQLSVGCLCQTAADTVDSLALIGRPPASTLSHVLSLPLGGRFTAPIANSICYSQGGGFFLEPGCRVGVGVSGTAAVGFTAFASLRITRLRS